MQTPPVRTRLLLIALALAFLAGCDLLSEVPPSSAPAGTQPAAATPPPGNNSNIARLNYLHNVTAGVEADRWSYEEGLEITLRALIGAANPRVVLGRQPLASYDLTGLVEAARQRAAEGAEEADDINAALRFLLLDRALLDGMTVEAGEPMPTSPGISPIPMPDPNDPDPEDVYFDPGSPSFDLACELFYRRFPVSADATTCLQARDGSVTGLDYRVFWPVPSIAPFYWTETHQGWLDEALADSVALYSQLGDLPSVDVVFAVNLDAPAEALTLHNGDECAVVLYTQMQHRSEDLFKQIVARQLAHCLQQATFDDLADARYADRSWYQDGLAAYLSNLVYPAADLEHEGLEALRLVDDDTSLFDWAGGAFVWFQFAGERLGTEALIDMIDSLPDGGPSEQAAALADWPGIDQIYHAFALAYTDGTIRDSSGERIPTDWRPGDRDGALAEAPGSHATVVVPSFAMRRSMIVIPTDRLADLAPAELPRGVRTSARAYGGREWGQLPQTFPPRCLEDNRLLVVTTSIRPEPQRRSLDVESFDTSCP